MKPPKPITTTVAGKLVMKNLKLVIPTEAENRVTKMLRLIIPLFLGLLLVFFWTRLLGRAAPTRAAPLSDQAHVAIQYNPHNQVVREIDFTAPISGLAALQLTGLEVITADYGFGVSVCSIAGVGCPADDCWCQYPKFWNYEYWSEGKWQSYSVGAGSSVVNGGAVEGWRWAEWGVGSLPPAPAMVAASNALKWLSTQQSETDGGVGEGAFKGSTSADSLIAIGSNQLEAGAWRRQPTSPSLMAYFLENARSYANTSGRAGKLATGLTSADGCWPMNVSQPLDFYDSSTGAFSTDANSQAWAMIGTMSLSQTVPLTATHYLTGMQQPDGGWGYPGLGSSTSTTAWAIQALIASGQPVDSSYVVSGLNFIKSTQNVDGGFYDTAIFGTASDTNSTANAAQAILAAGQDPLAGTWRIDSTNPISYLLSMQLSNGAFEWQTGFGADLMATAQAIPALLGRPFPLEIEALTNCPTLYLPAVCRLEP